MVHTHASVVLIIDVAQYLMTARVSTSLLQSTYGSNLNNEQLVNKYIEVREVIPVRANYIITRHFVFPHSFVTFMVTCSLFQLLGSDFTGEILRNSSVILSVSLHRIIDQK